jgi:hypothetical protein
MLAPVLSVVLLSMMSIAMRTQVPSVVTINRPDVVAMIEEAAGALTAGGKTEAVALAMRRLLEQRARHGSLFGAHQGPVRVRHGVDLVAPALDAESDDAGG